MFIGTSAVTTCRHVEAALTARSLIFIPLETLLTCYRVHYALAVLETLGDMAAVST